MHKDMKPKMKNAIGIDATRFLSKWLNEEPNTPIDRKALATVLARVGFFELELQAMRNAFEAMLDRAYRTQDILDAALDNIKNAIAIGNHSLNIRPTHYSSEPYAPGDEMLSAAPQQPFESDELRAAAQAVVECYATYEEHIEPAVIDRLRKALG